MSKRLCPIDGCGQMVAHEVLMCKPHWYQVPEELRVRIWRHWHRGFPDEKHAALCGSAIAFVNALKHARQTE